jgi:hypothetical protein
MKSKILSSFLLVSLIFNALCKNDLKFEFEKIISSINFGLLGFDIIEYTFRELYTEREAQDADSLTLSAEEIIINYKADYIYREIGSMDRRKDFQFNVNLFFN